MAIPAFARSRMQRVLVQREPFHLVHMGSSHQSAVETVSPGVIRAGDAPLEGAFLLFAKARPAMATDIEEGSVLSRFIPGDNQAFAGDRGQKIVPPAGDLFLTTDANPLSI